MKKFILLTIPLMTISLLASCANNSVGTYTMVFNGTHCTADNKDTYEKDKYVSFTITPDKNYSLPKSKEEIHVDGINSYDYDYYPDSGTAAFSCTITSNVSITVNATPATPPTPASYDIKMSSKEADIKDKSISLGDEFYESTVVVLNKNKILTKLNSVAFEKDLMHNIASFCEFKPSADFQSATIKIPTKYVSDNIVVNVELIIPEPVEHDILMLNENTNIQIIEKGEQYFIGTITVTNSNLMIAGRTTSLKSVRWESSGTSISFLCGYSVANNYQTATIRIPTKSIYYDNIEVDIDTVSKENGWYLNSSFINSLTSNDVGLEKHLFVNGQKHGVRLIGVNQDKDRDGNDIHTTWEFMNILSDSNGQALATQWNDAPGKDTSVKCNYNYLDSTLRRALTGNGNAPHFFWAQANQTGWSTTHNDTVINMIKKGNGGLIEVLKEPTKLVNVCNDITAKEIVFEETTINDKLFLLSPKEMGYEDSHQESRTSAYSYYVGHTEECDDWRIKKQVDENKILTSNTEMKSDSGQIYAGIIFNYAGYNHPTYGGWMWLRSPYVTTTSLATSWSVGYSRGGGEGNIIRWYGASAAMGVAPAFCI